MTAARVVMQYGSSKFHLVGHSMGGLTGLLLAHYKPSAVLSFTNIEGNLHPDDCFLSRQIIEFAGNNAEQFMASFVARTSRAPGYSCGLYASSLPHKVRARAVAPIFYSMVELSDHGALLDKFLALPLPRLFMYGDENQSLSYLGCLDDHGVQLAEVPHCGHFPMYANPLAMWDHIGAFIDQTEVELSHG
jgi:pimeloyl-ACP methyl ester carboxylesterase